MANPKWDISKKVEDMSCDELEEVGTISFITMEYIRRMYDVESFRMPMKIVDVVDILDSANDCENIDDLIKYLTKMKSEGFEKTDIYFSHSDSEFNIYKEKDSDHLENVNDTERRLQKKLKDIVRTKLKEIKRYNNYLKLKEEFECI